MADIEEEVARALRPDSSIESRLDSHKIMLQLAKTPAGHTLLVTTNFDSVSIKASFIRQKDEGNQQDITKGDLFKRLLMCRSRVCLYPTGYALISPRCSQSHLWLMSPASETNLRGKIMLRFATAS